MGQSLEQFAADCRRILKDTPGPDGREKVRALVEEVLKDDAFVAKHVGDDVPERKILYEDPDLGFCILAHVYHGAKESAPHDHGPTWAIYGQAEGETLMNEWAMVEPASEQARLQRQTATSAATGASVTTERYEVVDSFLP